MRRLIFAVVMVLVAIGCKRNNIDEVVEPSLIVDVDNIEIDYTKQSVEIAFESNVEEVDVDSIFWVIYEGVVDGKIVLMVMENTSTNVRHADVVITAGELSHTVTITQLPKPDMMTLGIGHRSATLDSPKWGGESVSGSIDWGDGVKELYEEGASHEYPDAELRTATFEMQGAESFKIESLGTIERVELTL